MRRAQDGLDAKAAWSWWRDALAPLLEEYAPWRTVNPQYPFRRMVGDALWEISDFSTLPAEAFVQSDTDIADLRLGWLNAHDPHAGLPAADHHALRTEPALRDGLVRLLLQRHFPPTVWQAVVEDAGLGHDLTTMVALPRDVATTPGSSARRRAAAFAAEVLAADEYRCVVCGYDGHERRRNNNRPVGLDAAHVRWWIADGPDEVSNGLALCATHHRLYDRGMYAFDPQRRALIVSPRYRSLGPVGGLPRDAPAPDRVADAHLAWHLDNVYRPA